MTSLERPSLSERYHAATVYTHERLSKARRLDFDRQPSPFKNWHQGQRVPLVGGGGQGETTGPGALDAERLGLLLYHCYGVTLVRQFPGASVHMRAAPSAGGLYPTELYVAVRGIDGIPDGLYDYHAPEHALVSCWEGDFWPDLEQHSFGHPAVAASNAVLIATGVHERSTWRYEDRGYRRVLLDTGHVLGNAALAAPAVGHIAVPIPHFVDSGINGLLLLDPAQEGALLLAALVEPDAHVLPRPPSRSSGVAAELTAAHASDPDAGSWIPVVHGAGALAPEASTVAEPDAPAVPPDGIALNAEPLSGGEAVLDTIRRRRSTRRFLTSEISLGVLGRLLGHAYPRAPNPAPDPTLEPGLLRTYVVVSAVAGLSPGVYRYHPGAHVLEPVRTGSPRMALWECALRQDLARDCAVSIVHTFDLPGSARRLGDRAYRTAHLEAGLIGQRLNVGAIQLGFGVSGIGGFFDDCVSALLDVEAHEVVAYITTVGVPA